jgi:hypothetical protein
LNAQCVALAKFAEADQKFGIEHTVQRTIARDPMPAAVGGALAQFDGYEPAVVFVAGRSGTLVLAGSGKRVAQRLESVVVRRSRLTAHAW